MAIYSELPVYRDSYRLLLEIYKVTNTFSREYKFSLGQDMRRDTLSLFRNLYRANKNQDKRVFLEAFLDDFELLKLQIRVCLDLKLDCDDYRQYRQADYGMEKPQQIAVFMPIFLWITETRRIKC